MMGLNAFFLAVGTVALWLQRAHAFAPALVSKQIGGCQWQRRSCSIKNALTMALSNENKRIGSIGAQAGAEKALLNVMGTADKILDDVVKDTSKLFHTGTKAVKAEPVDPPSILDDIMTVVFQIGGKFLWPNDNAQLAVGHIGDLIGDRPLFMPLYKYFRSYGGVYKLSFAPVPQATFYVLSDPKAVKHVLSTRPMDYDKGLLAEILKPILGKGLIPADQETWKVRRPVIQPGFHKAWLDRMTLTFSDCSQVMMQALAKEVALGTPVNMEEKFNSVSLDIIGKAVFNYEFGSVTSESPVIKAAYACLKVLSTSIRQNASAYVSIRQHTSAYV